MNVIILFIDSVFVLCKLKDITQFETFFPFRINGISNFLQMKENYF